MNRPPPPLAPMPVPVDIVDRGSDPIAVAFGLLILGEFACFIYVLFTHQ